MDIREQYFVPTTSDVPVIRLSIFRQFCINVFDVINGRLHNCQRPCPGMWIERDHHDRGYKLHFSTNQDGLLILDHSLASLLFIQNYACNGVTVADSLLFPEVFERVLINDWIMCWTSLVLFTDRVSE
jgi:hypothetical protein